jgi:outer membrane protein
MPRTAERYFELALAQEQFWRVLELQAGLGVGAERVQALAQALEASISRRDATRVGHEVGGRTTLDLLNAENDIAAARYALAQARVGLLLDRLRLAALADQLDDTVLRSVDQQLAIPRPPAR